MDATIQVGKRGTSTPPAELRTQYNIQPGDTFRLLDLNGVFRLTPMFPVVPGLAPEIEPAPAESGLSVEEMLHGLQTQRERCPAQRYAADEALA